MWHLDNIYHGKERKDMYWFGFVFPCAGHRHGLNALNVFKAVGDTFCSFTVLDHTRLPLIILIYKIKSELAQLHHFGKNSFIITVQRM